MFITTELLIEHVYINRSERVSDCCLTPIQQLFSYIMAKTS